MGHRIGAILVVTMAGLLLATASPVPACTGIQLQPKDGSIIYARTLEFGSDLQSSILIVPRNKAFVGSAPGDRPGLRWTSKYAAVGTNAFKYEVFMDGLNEKGLAVGFFYFPGFAGYQAIEPGQEGQTVGPHELGAYLLTTCASVDEAIAAARKIKVGDVVVKEMGFTPPAHYVLHDSTGKCAVLEYVQGKLNVHDNPLGVMSNAPTFDWHLTNVRNYINLSKTSAPALHLGGVTFASLGQGSGMLGLPGDFTPPSRFVRAVAFSKSALPTETAGDGVLQAFHILNQFDIPKGASRQKQDGAEEVEYTLWTSASDLKNQRYYYRTFANSRIRVVDLRSCDLNATQSRFISMHGPEEILDVTNQGK